MPFNGVDKLANAHIDNHTLMYKLAVIPTKKTPFPKLCFFNLRKSQPDTTKPRRMLGLAKKSRLTGLVIGIRTGVWYVIEMSSSFFQVSRLFEYCSQCSD